MEKKRFWRQLLPLMLPIAFQNMMQSLVSASDAVMMGFIDQTSLSAVSLAAQIAFVVSLFVFGLTNAGSVLAAQYWGKGSRPEVEQVFGIMTRPLLLVGSAFTLAALLVPHLLMRIFTTDVELIAVGSDYLRAVSLSYVLTCLNQGYLCIMRNSGKAIISSVIGSSAVVINIILNAVLIFGLLGLPALGAVGAALATVITRIIELVWILWETSKPGSIHLRREYLLGKCPLRRDYWSQGWILTANNLIWGLGITMGSVILGRLGSDAVAANSIASVMKNLIGCFCMGLASGGAIMVGNELGAGRLESGKAYGKKVVSLSLITGVISGGILIALTPLIVNLAELTPQAEQYLRWMIVVCAWNLVGMSHNSATISGIFTAGGDTRFGLICDIVVLWVIVVPVGMLAAFVFKCPVLLVYVFINMDEWVKFPAVRVHYRKYRWVRDLTRKKEDAQ